ncbi:restriction endonuclease [Streptomyces sp. NPDC000594]|uniref:restriction endonuclease n=1 Tax=Streptomyces sp. NPDC000594 TaxID=3154261 RepID=UPI00332E95B4
MIDNPSSLIALPRYANPGLARMMQEGLAAASQDALLAAYLWAQEEAFAWAVVGAVERWQEEVGAEQKYAHSRAFGDHTAKDFWVPMREDWQQLIGLTATRLDEATDHLGALASEAREIHEQFVEASGDPDRYSADNATGEQLLDEAALLYGKAEEVRKGVDRILREERGEVHRLLVFNAECRTYRATSRSRSLEQVDYLHHQEFEELTAWLLERDGHAIERRTGGPGDMGADVIAVSPSGQRVVVQCKHVGTSGRSMGNGALHGLNGTARPVHKADIVIAVTNGGFARQGRRFAEEQGIHLIDRAALQRWATWGRPVSEILGLPAPDTPAT